MTRGYEAMDGKIETPYVLDEPKIATHKRLDGPEVVHKQVIGFAAKMPEVGDVVSRILGASSRTLPTSPTYAADQAGHTLTVVLVGGAVGDYAAYAGFGSPEWVARFGDKVSFEEACGHFPGGQLQRGRYRD